MKISDGPGAILRWICCKDEYGYEEDCSILVRIGRLFLGVILLPVALVLALSYPVRLQPRRLFKALLFTAFWSIPAFLLILRLEEELAWEASIIQAFGIVFIGIPFMWSILVLTSFGLSYFLKFLFLPNQ